MRQAHRWVIGVALLVAGCGAVVSSPTPTDDAQRSVAAVKVALTAAYTTTADLVQAGKLSQDDGRMVYANLSRAEAALATAEARLVSDPTSAANYLATALQIALDQLGELQKVQPAPVAPVAPIRLPDGGAA